MPEPQKVIDLAGLLEPIPGETAVGTDLRAEATPDSLYTRLRDARAEARASERAMETEDAIATVPPQWRVIRDLATEALSTKTKDLEIAAWFTEALLRSDGLDGFSAGLELMSGLVEQYWDSLFPLPDEDGIETRLAPIATLNGRSGDGTLIQPLRRVTLFIRPDGDPLQFWQYEQAVGLAGIVDEARRAQRLNAGVIPFETVEAEAQLAGPASFVELSRSASAAAEAWRGLSDALDVRAGADAPPTSRVRDLLEQLNNVAKRFAGPAASDGAGAETPTTGASDDTPGAGAILPSVVVPGAIDSRADALRSLAAIAAYFRRTEPLSPLAYTLEEVVRRAGLTWPQLLDEIIPDPGTRAAVLSSLGIRPPPTE